MFIIFNLFLFLVKSDKRWVRYKKKRFLIQKLGPLDFIEGVGIPYSLFQNKTGFQNVHELMGDIKSDAVKDKEYKEKIKLIESVLQKGIIRPKNFKPKLILKKNNVDIGFFIYARIISMNLKKFNKIYTMNNKYMIFLDSLARRYGKTPLEVLFPADVNKFTDLESYMFNVFVFTIGMNNENEIIKRGNAKIKKQNASINAKRKGRR